MSLFSKILGKIFPSGHPAVTGTGGAPGTPPQGPMAPAGGSAGAATTPAANPAATGNAPAGAPSPAAAQPATPQAPAQPVDVAAVLTFMAANNPQKLNWKTSIVDLLKLLDLDSSLAARQSLAQELGYTGNTSDSAAMNIWLHKQVMNKLAQNGGKVPADLQD